MQFGSSLPLVPSEDSTALRDLAQALAGFGFDFVSLGGHVLGTEVSRYPDRRRATYTGPFHDPFVTFAYLAAITQRVHFMTSILILPALPTALVAKQSAALQALSGGRFELGVGISWNPLEFAALGRDITTRGRRIEEQIALLRRLWSEPYVTFDGRWEHLEDVGLGTIPAAPIPIWFGSGTGEQQLRRAARLADGWVMGGGAVEMFAAAAGDLRRYVEEAGRDPAAFKLSTSLFAGPEGSAAWIEAARALKAAGATRLSIFAPPDLDAAASLARVIDARAVLAEALGQAQ